MMQKAGVTLCYKTAKEM
jgi:hypothetical protein